MKTGWDIRDSGSKSEKSVSDLPKVSEEPRSKTVGF